METKTQGKKAKKGVATSDAPPTTEQHQGIDPVGIFRQVMGSEFDPSRVQTISLEFGTRKRGKGGKFSQTVSVIDMGGMGEGIEVFPVVSRFQPHPGHRIRCFVVIRKTTRDGKQIQYGFAIPIDLRGTARSGEWLPPRVNVLTLQFREREDGTLFAFGPNGKIVLVAPGVRFRPSVDEEASYMVSERLSCYYAHCLVERAKGDVNAEAQEAGLVRLAEDVGATIRAVDDYGFYFAGSPTLHDACMIMGVDKSASKEAIEKRRLELAETEHPDKKRAWHIEFTGSAPSPDDMQVYTHEFSLILRAAEVMESVRKRLQYADRYGEPGTKADSSMPAQLTVAELATRLGQSTAAIIAALGKIGYPDRLSKSEVCQQIAWVVAGLIVSGDMNKVDDVSEVQGVRLPAPVEAAPTEPEAHAPNDNGGKERGELDLVALRTALGMGCPYNGRPAAELVAELKAAGKLSPSWPAPEAPAPQAETAPAAEAPAAE